LIGAEVELGDKAVSSGWADVSKQKLDEWKKIGLELRDELEKVTQEVMSVEYGRLMRKRLALRRTIPTDESEYFRPLLDLMESHKLDFHSTFRTLCSFKPSVIHASNPTAEDATQPPASLLDTFITRLLASTPEPDRLDQAKATSEWREWLEKYARRIENERDDWVEAVDSVAGDMDAHIDRQRELAAKSANPRFVLRQWVLEEVIKKVENDTDSGKRVLAKVMHMACNPFGPWGAEQDERRMEELNAEEKEERRYCGLGEKKMLGFQCSCSS